MTNESIAIHIAKDGKLIKDIKGDFFLSVMTTDNGEHTSAEVAIVGEANAPLMLSALTSLTSRVVEQVLLASNMGIDPDVLQEAINDSVVEGMAKAVTTKSKGTPMEPLTKALNEMQALMKTKKEAKQKSSEDVLSEILSELRGKTEANPDPFQELINAFIQSKSK